MNKTTIFSGVINAVTLVLSIITLLLFKSGEELHFYIAGVFGVWVSLSLLINLVLILFKLIKRDIKQAAVVILLTILCIVISFVILILGEVPPPSV